MPNPNENPSIAIPIVKEVGKTINIICKIAGLVLCVYIMKNGLVEIAAKQPEQIGELAKVVEAAHAGVWLSWLASIIFGGSAYLSHWKKQRIEKKYKKLKGSIMEHCPNWSELGIDLEEDEV